MTTDDALAELQRRGWRIFSAYQNKAGAWTVQAKRRTGRQVRSKTGRGMVDEVELSGPGYGDSMGAAVAALLDRYAAPSPAAWPAEEIVLGDLI